MGSPRAASSPSRIVSMDQFRGYTIAGMILVNFLGDFTLSHHLLSHHNTYFSYADSIMPAFHFAVGFAFRLTLLRRLQKEKPAWAGLHFIRRNLGLILLSFALNGLEHSYPTWDQLRTAGIWNVLAEPLKCQFWETLAIIGVTSLWLLPVMAASVRVRLLFLVASALVHVLISQLFYFRFLWGQPNALDAYWGAADVRGLDGGPFGFLAWGIPQLVGSFAYDVVARRPGVRAFLQLAAYSALLMGLGYGLSCLSGLYEPPSGAGSVGAPSVATSPVIPPGDWATINWRQMLVEPPFVPPPADRQLNYWMMSKRAATLSFMLFASGFATAVYALFVLLCDVGSLRIGIFRTFGQNALAAYVIHEIVNHAIRPLAPADSPLWWVSLAFATYVGITYLFVRHLEKNGIYLRM